MKEIEELMKPRYKVIADFPGNDVPVGDIIKPYKLGKRSEKYLNEYPNIYRKLYWWEERSIEDLPKYVKLVQPDYHYSVQEAYKWDIEKGYVKTKEWDAAQSLKIFEPATFEEYQSYQSIKSLK